MALMMIAALMSVATASPEAFGLHQVKSITGPEDDAGEVSWATSDVPAEFGWKPFVYDESIVVTLYGEPEQVAPGITGWAFAIDEAPDFGVLLIRRGPGDVVPKAWDWGNLPAQRMFKVGPSALRASSAWLNALAEVHRDGRAQSPTLR